MCNIAIISPSQDAYSETFIQAQKKYLKGNVFYYFGGKIPTQLEGSLIKLNRAERLTFKIQKKMKRASFNSKEVALIKSFKKQKIDVIIAQYGPTAQVLLKVCRHLNIPLITHFHGYDASIYETIKRFENYKEVFAYSSKVIAVSKKMEQMLLDIGCPKEKLVQNTYGPQPEFLEVKSTFSKKQFIAIGRFTDKKAPYYTIIAFKEVVKKHPDAVLFIAGDGVLLNTCKNLIQLYKLENNIKLLGVISSFEFRKYLSESIAFVQHSITANSGDMEGTPLAVLESSAAGLPVIATNHAGIPDVIINNETGFIVEEHDVEAMADKMCYAIENIDNMKEMGEKGKERIQENFTLERYIKVLDELVQQVI